MNYTETQHITLEDQGIDLIRQASTILGVYGYTLNIDDDHTDCISKDKSHHIMLMLNEEEKLSFIMGWDRNNPKKDEIINEAHNLAEHIITTVNVLNFK